MQDARFWFHVENADEISKEVDVGASVEVSEIVALADNETTLKVKIGPPPDSHDEVHVDVDISERERNVLIDTFLNLPNASQVEEIQPSHRYLFIGGAHNSGTSLMTHLFAALPEFSVFQATGVPEDEGQHLQSEYPTARMDGGPCHYALSSRQYLTSDSLTRVQAERVLNSWKMHWNASKRIFVKNSPPHVIQTQFLQEIVMPSQSSFILLIRHPLDIHAKRCRGTPLNVYLENWLRQYEALRRDAPFIKRLRVVRFEEWVSSPTTLAATHKELQQWVLEGAAHRHQLSLRGNRSAYGAAIFAKEERREREIVYSNPRARII